jgi:hypothetical protein
MHLWIQWKMPAAIKRFLREKWSVKTFVDLVRYEPKRFGSVWFLYHQKHQEEEGDKIMRPKEHDFSWHDLQDKRWTTCVITQGFWSSLYHAHHFCWFTSHNRGNITSFKISFLTTCKRQIRATIRLGWQWKKSWLLTSQQAFEKSWCLPDSLLESTS